MAIKPFTLVVLAFFVLVTIAVAVRLLRLAARTHKAPELLLGVSLLLPMAGYAGMVVAAVRAGGTPPRSAVEAGGLVIDLGFVAVASFVLMVFRREEAWARALWLLLAAASLAMPVLNHVLPWQGTVPPTMWPRAVLRTACDGWAAVEALWYARLMWKRVRFGLGDPLVADRFRLWGLGHAFMALTLDALTAGAAMHMERFSGSEVFVYAGAAFSLSSSIAFALSFFPPQAYLLFVAGRSAEGAT